MASYTQVQAVTNLNYMCADGAGNLYVTAYDSGTPTLTVYQYNIASDTLTDISGASFDGHIVGSGSPSNPEWWIADGNLYCATGIWNPTNEAYVHRWNGGQNWTTVFTGTWVSTLSLNALLKGDQNRLAFRYASTNHELWATTDGTTWNQQDYDGTQCTGLYYDVSQRNELVIKRYKNPNYDMRVHSAGNTWAAIAGSDPATWYFCGTEGTYQFFRTLTGDIERSTDWAATSTTLPNGPWTIADAFGPGVYDLTHEVVSVGTTTDANVGFWNPITLTFDLDGTPSPGNFVVREPVYYGGYLYVAVSGVGIYVRDDPIGPVVTKVYSTGGWSPKAMDVSADDYYLYVGVLDAASQPVLLRLPSDLSADPTAVYEPGAGSAIGVQCGDEDESWVWIAGDFGAPKVRLSIDDGTTWTTKDPGTWNGVALPHVVGPWWDNLVLVPTDGDDDLFETEDGGLNWTTLNAALPFDVGGMDRLDINLDEIVIGSDAGRDIQYSPNNGASFEDISDVSMDDVPITDVIIG